LDNYTTYPNGFIVVDPTGVYSKHYYMGSQRIASRVGDTYTFTTQTKSAETSAMADLKTKQQKEYQAIKKTGCLACLFYSNLPLKI
jgi:hypothetical protein